MKSIFVGAAAIFAVIVGVNQVQVAVNNDDAEFQQGRMAFVDNEGKLTSDVSSSSNVQVLESNGRGYTLNSMPDGGVMLTPNNPQVFRLDAKLNNGVLVIDEVSK